MTKTAKQKPVFKNKVTGKAKAPSSMKATIIVVVIIAQTFIILVLVFALTMNNNCAENGLANAINQVVGAKPGPKKYTDIIGASSENGEIGDHVLGKRDSKARVIMYVDMQCPACASMMPHFAEIYNEHKDEAAFIIRYYVIKGHDYARAAAIAVEAAARQGYYWEMMNAMFNYRANWAYVNSDKMLTERFVDVFDSVSAGKGDKEKFVKDLKDEKLAKKVDFDHEIGKRDSLDATPTIIINGEDVDFANSSESVEELINNKIKEALK